MKAITNLRFSLATMFFFGACALASAATITWTNTASGNWNVAANWNPNQVPGASDTAVITNNSVTVTLDISPTVGGIILGADAGCGGGTTLLMNGQTLTLNGPFVVGTCGQFTVDSGTLSGAANATLSGVLGWGGGSFANLAGTLTLATNGTLNITAETYHDMPGGTLINNGTVLWTGGAVRGGSGTLIQNNGLWIAQVTNTINSAWGLTPAFNNGGTFDVQSGTIDFSMAGTSTGTFHVAAGATCNFNYNYNFNSGTALTGAGTNRLNGYTCTLNGTIYVQNVEFTAGQLAGNHILSGSNGFAGSFTWIDGKMNTHGATTIASNATLSIVSANLHDLPFHTLTNNGTVVSSGGDVRGGNGCFIQNSGLWLIQADNALSDTYGAGMGFNNTGIFRKTAGVGTNTVSCDFTNNGTVSAQSGTLAFSASFANPVGTIAVSGGSAVQFTQPLVLLSGLVTGSGTIQAPSIISGAVVNPGNTNAVLTISGSYIQLYNGSIQFDIGGTLPGTNQSQVNVTGPAALDGQIELRFSPGYSPAVGSSNVVLTASPLMGKFCCFDHCFLLGQNKHMVAAYNPTNVTLTAVSAPDPSGPSLGQSLQEKFLVCWPSEFTNFGLYFTTNLSSPSWTPIPGVTNHYLENPLSAPRKFFILIK
jgi:hypothetical protein